MLSVHYVQQKLNKDKTEIFLSAEDVLVKISALMEIPFVLVSLLFLYFLSLLLSILLNVKIGFYTKHCY